MSRTLIGPGLPPPDWSRVMVHPDQKKMPVGDPTLWANTITTPIDEAPEGNIDRAFYGEQIVLAAAADRYSRSWSLIGSLTIYPSQPWAEEADFPPNGPFPHPGTQIAVFLSILQGIEKVTIEQQICLMAGGGTTKFGLCNTQSSVNDGPYVPTYTDAPPNENSGQTRPFAAIGALIGNTISIRGLFVRGGDGSGNKGLVKRATISCLVTPYAPGTGL